MSQPESLDALLARLTGQFPPVVPPTLTAEEQTALDAAETERRWQSFAASIGVPRRLWPASLEAGDPRPALLRAGLFVREDLPAGRCLVLTGPTGVGKSFAAVAALRAARGLTRRFWYFPALCGALLDPGRRVEALQAAKTTPLVVWDDFGVEYVREGGLIDAFLDELIWHREAEMLPTLITTNLTTEALKSRLPDRLIDRLRGEWGRIFECPGESLR